MKLVALECSRRAFFNDVHTAELEKTRKPIIWRFASDKQTNRQTDRHFRPRYPFGSYRYLWGYCPFCFRGRQPFLAGESVTGQVVAVPRPVRCLSVTVQAGRNL